MRKEILKPEVLFQEKGGGGEGGRKGEEKSFIDKTERSQGHVQKGTQECLYLNYCDISSPLLS
jgi:hypothetical protein